jgi:hypothetical protein
MVKLLGSILAILLVLEGSADALEVYLNGVRATGLKNQTLQNCTVTFDAFGNIQILAKGYAVKKVEGTPTGNSPGVRGKYFLVSTFSRPGYAQFDVDVYVNGKWIRKVRSGEGQVILEISKFLPSGRVTVLFAATKNLGGKPRLSTSSADYLQVLVGEGTAGGGTVNITRTLAEFRATADRTGNYNQESVVQIP